MGQEEMRRRCRMSGGRCRARENRLTKIFTINKGDAIMKKRIIALVLACMLICSIAVTASAATATYSGRYGNCLYTATTTCSVRSYSASIEGTPVGGTSNSDYILRADVYVVRMNPGLGDDIMETIVGGSSTGIAFNNKTYTANVFNITAYYYINGTQVYYKSLNAS